MGGPTPRDPVVGHDGTTVTVIKSPVGEDHSRGFLDVGKTPDQQAAALRAKGFSNALERIDGIAQNIDANTQSLQYSDTLGEVGAGRSIRSVFPIELADLFSLLLGMGDQDGPTHDLADD